jgi:hypothetical protein
MMKLQELQKQLLQLPTQERWELVQTLLISLREETRPEVKPKNLARLRGIAKITEISSKADHAEDYVNYLTKKYQ